MKLTRASRIAAFACCGIAACSTYGEDTPSPNNNTAIVDAGVGDGSSTNDGGVSNSSDGSASGGDASLDAPLDGKTTVSCRPGFKDDFEDVAAGLTSWTTQTPGASTANITKSNPHAGIRCAGFHGSGTDPAYLQRPGGGTCAFTLDLWFAVDAGLSTSALPIVQIAMGMVGGAKELISVTWKGTVLEIASGLKLASFILAAPLNAYRHLTISYEVSGLATLTLDSTVRTMDLAVGSSPSGLALGLLGPADGVQLYVDDVTFQ